MVDAKDLKLYPSGGLNNVKKPKGNKHYRVGYSLERDVKKALEQQGYTVFRSAGSHSEADLIALYPTDCEGLTTTGVRLIQCKRHKNLMTNKELKDFYYFAENLGANATIAWRDKGIHIEDIGL